MRGPSFRSSPTPFHADFEHKLTNADVPCVLTETLRGADLPYPERWEAVFKNVDELGKRLVEAGLPVDIVSNPNFRNVPVGDREHLAILGMKLKGDLSFQ
jgi:hypothetical protein